MKALNKLFVDRLSAIYCQNAAVFNCVCLCVEQAYNCVCFVKTARQLCDTCAPSYCVFISFCAYAHVPALLFVCGCVLCLWLLASHGCSELTRTKLAGNHPSSSSIWPHHQSLLEASSTLMTSPALNANSRSAMVTWSHTASALTIEPPLINWRDWRERKGHTLCLILVTWSRCCGRTTT